jgi:hypothetical protein
MSLITLTPISIGKILPVRIHPGGSLETSSKFLQVRFCRLDADQLTPIFCHLAYIRAREQRIREKFIAIEEMKQLQEKISRCYYTHTIDHQKYCGDLAQEYLRRLKCPEYVCKSVRPSFHSV